MLRFEPMLIRFGSVLKECSTVVDSKINIIWEKKTEYDRWSKKEETTYIMRTLNVRTGVISIGRSRAESVVEVVNNDQLQVILALSTNPQISAEHIYQNLKLFGVSLDGIKFVRTHSGGLLIFKDQKEITLEEFILNTVHFS